MSAVAPPAIARDIDIATEPPVNQARLSGGMTARNHRPKSGIASIGTSKRAIVEIRRWRSSRVRSRRPTTRMPTRAARVIATIRR
jgi:hypothetical protein